MTKKTILSSIFAIALVAVSGFGINRSVNNDANLSDLALANVEALAHTETGDEFYAATGCHATIQNISCTGKDGKLIPTLTDESFDLILLNRCS